MNLCIRNAITLIHIIEQYVYIKFFWVSCYVWKLHIDLVLNRALMLNRDMEKQLKRHLPDLHLQQGKYLFLQLKLQVC